VLKAEGPVFSAGHDLKELKAAAKPEEIFNECTKTLLFLKRLPIITLCAINGVAAAAGFQMALTCDLIVAT
jgi:enoyl-CoA hydratase/carnithine racemase